MDDVPATCGQGIAANADLPAALSEMMAAMAGVFDGHKAVLDRTDAESRQEFEAYDALARAHDDVAASLAALSQQMLAQQDLPNGIHDIAAMQAPGGQADAYARYVSAAREAAALLAAKVASAEGASE